MTAHAICIIASLAGLSVLGGCASGALPTAKADDTGRRGEVIEVRRSPDCTCCHDWEAYLVRHGYEVRSIPTVEMAAVKTTQQIPVETWSCHTATAGGYVIEGHVPIEAIEDLLADRPEVDGIGLPGMPAGSPGMPGEKVGSFQVLAFAGGVTSPFGSY